MNPGYRQIGYYHGDGDTAVEETVDWRIFPNTRRQSDYTIGRSRDTLRGYDWVTIVAQELADTLGGAEELAATGAFAGVRRLTRGGVALQTTADFRDYAIAEPAFRALAPILPPGRPPLVLPRAPNQIQASSTGQAGPSSEAGQTQLTVRRGQATRQGVPLRV